MMRFDRFTERAQDVAARAYEILQRYGHNQVDTEHLLLALLEQPEGVVTTIVERLSVDVSQMTSTVDDVLRASPRVSIYGGGGATGLARCHLHHRGHRRAALPGHVAAAVAVAARSHQRVYWL